MLGNWKFRWRGGFALLELVASIAIIALLVLGVISVFHYALAMVAENKSRSGAIVVAERRLELVRNLPYDAVGTVGGIPSGALPQSVNETLSRIVYAVATQISYVDDPFDGTLGGTPNDLLANDYKKVRVAVSWTGRFGAKTYVAVSTVAPRDVETSAGGGTLSILVFDASGNPVPQADVTVVNSTVSPPVNTTVQTDGNGRFLFPGAPPSVNGYAITATKAGYSTDKTCAIDAAGLSCSASEGNPTPTKPHATVIADQLTEVGLAIDRPATMVVRTIRQPTPSLWVVNTGGGAFDQDNPATTLCPNGNTLFVWRDFRQNNNPRIYAQQYDVNRNPVWTPDLAVTTSNNQNNPDVAATAGCEIYYAWNDDRNGNQDIYFDKYTAAGTDAWVGEKKVDVSAQNADQTWPQVVVNASSTVVYLVWQDARDDGGDIYAKKYDPDGNALWGNEVKVNSDGSEAVQSTPKIALDADQNLVFLWHDNRSGNDDVYAQKLNPDGVKLWAGDVRMHTDSGTADQTNGSLAFSNDSALFAVWEDGRNGNPDIFAQRYDGNGVPQWASDVRVNSDAGTASQALPQIIATPSSTLYVVWEDGRNGSSDVYLQKLDFSGAKMIAFDVRINSNGTGEQGNPDLVLNAAGYPVIVWQDNSSGNFDIQAAIFGEDPQTVTDVGNVNFTLSSGKRIGENPVILKYRQSHATDGSGRVEITGLEWDPGYTLAPIGYTLLGSEPAQPVALNPNTTVTVYLNLQ